MVAGRGDRAKEEVNWGTTKRAGWAAQSGDVRCVDVCGHAREKKGEEREGRAR